MIPLNHALAGALLAAVALPVFADDPPVSPSCQVEPKYTVIAEGQAIELTASCTVAITGFTWKLDDKPLENGITANILPGTTIKFVTPAALGVGDWPFTFEATHSGPEPNLIATAEVQVGSSNALAIVTNANAQNKAQFGVADGTCGDAAGGSATAMPSGADQCTAGTPSLMITNPTQFTWTCAGTAGGTDASCYAIKGFTVTATAGSHGTVSPATQPVAAGATATISVNPDQGYSASASGCGGSLSGGVFTTGPITSNCSVTASFNNLPVNGQCGNASSTTPVTDTPTANLCNTGSATAVSLVTGTYQWTCSGANGGQASAVCSVPRGYSVTAVANDTNGSVSAPGSLVAHGAPATIAITSTAGFVPSIGPASTCPAGSLSGSGTNWSYVTGALTGACDVRVNFAPAPTGISCNGVSMPGAVEELGTPLPGASVARVMHSPVSGNDVFAFKLVVPADFTAQSVRTLAVTKTTATSAGKRVTISECRGDYEPADKSRGCTGMGTEVTSLNYAINYSTSVAPTTRYCHLTPGKTYWVNVSSRADAAAAPNCSSAANCKFYFESN